MMRSIILILLVLIVPIPANAFCGFYVARAESKLFNKASQVVLVRDDEKTVITMSNDFQGDVKDFAVVVPVPTFIQREQIHITGRSIVEHLDAYSAPRLVEYFDENPCMVRRLQKSMAELSSAMEDAEARHAKSLGVTIEAQYSVGEYDILILSAKQSGGLIIWLEENGYQLPEGAEPVVGSYIKQGMKFFIAKVNLKEQQNLGFSYLRPLQVAYESAKFMLPIRLGTLNANGPQELFVYALTRMGRVETTNYRTVKIPSNLEVPLYVKDEFAEFYQTMFQRQVEKEKNRAVFLEYAWDMAWCDPCAADPLSHNELRELGVMWLRDVSIQPQQSKRRIIPPSPAANVFITRLHLRYDKDHFPDDLRFQVTADRNNFQGRYIIRHPWDGSDDCPAAKKYRDEELPKRQQQQANKLASLTGRSIDDIWEKMGISNRPVPKTKSWWKTIWPDKSL